MRSLTLGLQIVRNSASNLARYALSIPVFFFLTPYILSKLGDEQFGVWVLIATFLSFADLGDLGMRSALRKYYAEAYAQRDYEALNADFSTAILIFFPLSLFIWVVIYLSLGVILQTFFCGRSLPPGRCAFCVPGCDYRVCGRVSLHPLSLDPRGVSALRYSKWTQQRIDSPSCCVRSLGLAGGLGA